MVIWIIGLSGSGKSYLANKIYKELLKKKKKIISVDGDDVRKFLTYDLGYTLQDRKKNSIFISDLCKFLENKGFIVVCSILSIFKEHQKKNRKKFNKYLQIYINSNFDKLKKINFNKVYHLNKNVVGKDILFPKPYKSDFILDPANKIEYKKIYKKIISKIK